VKATRVPPSDGRWRRDARTAPIAERGSRVGEGCHISRAGALLAERGGQSRGM